MGRVSRSDINSEAMVIWNGFDTPTFRSANQEVCQDGRRRGGQGNGGGRDDLFILGYAILGGSPRVARWVGWVEEVN